MKKRAASKITSRKRPRQERSTRLVEDILEAAIRVLSRDGAPRFTTARVAEEAGVSVGSLYQYFPNKEALLFRLQADEWKETGDLVAEILNDHNRAPLDRLRYAIRVFFRSERDEAELRAALHDAAIPYEDAPEAQVRKAVAQDYVVTFLEEAVPTISPKQRAFAAEVLRTSMTAIGARVTRDRRPRDEVDAWADVVADMCCGYLERLASMR